ncbi:unnamed protein product [Schistosoma curassoni]|uniref:RALGAPB_N domain-containing protein n=1 Tax=Schistosoma curassoni TaxID=6186 RepID=A0A183JPG5_9TREM|nr:unnamed protein product [Schistosoma curassoni]
MLENMANIFYASSLNPNLSESQNTNKISTTGTDYTKYQIDLCRLVLQIFQFASNSNELTSETWSKLLSILMDIMRKTMVNTSPNNVQNYKWLSNNKLTQNLFQTLNGALLRASLFSTISSESWDQCLNVYSQLSHWPSLIIEWKVCYIVVQIPIYIYCFYHIQLSTSIAIGKNWEGVPRTEFDEES